jgi:hypothetical protein
MLGHSLLKQLGASHMRVSFVIHSFSSPPFLSFFAPSLTHSSLSPLSLLAHTQGAHEHLLGVHIRVTMSKEAGAGGDTQIGPSSTIPLRRQGQVFPPFSFFSFAI